MLVFATSDKGGTGRSITSANVAYRHALDNHDVCYLDFDFGSPTAGAVFNVAGTYRGVTEGGLHSYLWGREQTTKSKQKVGLVKVARPREIDIWSESHRISLRRRPGGAGRLVLIPGDQDGGESPPDDDSVQRCARLFSRLEEEFSLILVDLSAGRSHATQLVLQATAQPALNDTVCRWLVFHRWTRQHIPAAEGLAFGEHGILDLGVRCGHQEEKLRRSIRFVRTAYVNPDSGSLAGLRDSQVAWLRACDQDLNQRARDHRVGSTSMLGSIPLDPVLQWREQLISDRDVLERDIANPETVEAFEELARNITNDAAWESL